MPLPRKKLKLRVKRLPMKPRQLPTRRKQKMRRLPRKQRRRLPRKPNRLLKKLLLQSERSDLPIIHTCRIGTLAEKGHALDVKHLSFKKDWSKVLGILR